VPSVFILRKSRAFTCTVGKESSEALEEGVLTAAVAEDGGNEERDCVALDLEVDNVGCFPFLVFIFFAWWGAWIFAESPAEKDLDCFMVGAFKALIGISCRPMERVPEAATGLCSGIDLMSGPASPAENDLNCFMVGAFKALIGISWRPIERVPEAATGLCSGIDSLSGPATESGAELRFRETNSVSKSQIEAGMCSGGLISSLAIAAVLGFERFVFASLGFFRNGMLLSCSCSASEHQERINNKLTFGTLN